MKQHPSAVNEGPVASDEANLETVYPSSDFPHKQGKRPQEVMSRDRSSTGGLSMGNDNAEVSQKTTGIGSSLTDDERMKILSDLSMQ